MRYAIYLCVLLAGCASPERLAALRAQEQAQAQAQQEAYNRQVFGQCRAYGFTEGTPDFRNCLMQVDQANQAQNAQIRAQILQQYLQEQSQARPLCSSLPPGLDGYRRARGECR